MNNIINETFTKHLGLMQQHLKLLNEDVEAPDNLKYKKEGSGITITGCDPKPTGDLIIPDTIDGLPITSIGKFAFQECSGLTSVTLPSSLTSIGDRAFNKCSGLKSVTLPSSLTSISYSAFGYCTGLTSVTLPNSITFLGQYAFKECSGLTSVTIPNNIDAISDGTFGGCTGLTSVTLPSSVRSLSPTAFPKETKIIQPFKNPLGT